MVERASESRESKRTEETSDVADPMSTLKDVQGLFSDQLSDEEKKALAALDICSDANAERLAGLLTALCRSR